ncbi:MAG: conjugal transfer protein TraG N-terminal domain-containing protein, partial [Pseudomonadales bacterium]|nr:conjugal transfer protein TraG N-terminal domain-containing protein [Pseudomonadales bacterium]
MATDFDVITYANGPFLYDVFNGVASIFGNGNYTVAMATCMTAASIGIMISAVLQGRMVNLLWMLQAIFLYMLLVLPKVSVNIVDKTEIDAAYVSVGAFPSVRRVDNIPIGMALVASSVSTFSSWTVDSFETVFSLPDSMKYTANGPLFGQNLVRKMISYQPNDASLNSNLQEFWRNCVFYDIGLGFYSFNDLSQQNNIVSFLKSNTAMTRGFYQESEGVKSFTDCR